MTHARQEWEKLEARDLAPYAAHSARSLGRLYPEPDHPVRPCFQRDRDRVLHSRCFRRLEYKTQVFVNGTADHYRTRLTHTIEMAAVGRTLARAFHVNEDLTETICLAHDVGHSPFGHRGEDVLDDLMKEHGGFDHNLQSLRAVEKLEYQYPGFCGLNLSWEVRAGLLKHQAANSGAQLDGHTLGQLEQQVFWKLAAARTREQYAALDDGHFLRITIRNLLDLQAQEVLREGHLRIEKYNPHTIADVMNAPERLITFGGEMSGLLDEFSKFMYRQLYEHSAVLDANHEAVALMRGLFLHYIEHPETMGRKARERISEEGLWRTVCDYVAGCTDRYALEECQKYGIGA